MIFNSICIIGLGLIGGSLAKAIKKSYPKCRITVVDRDMDSLDAALSLGVAHRVTASLSSGVKGAGLVFLCTPLNTIPSLMEEVFPYLGKDTILTDVGSTKGDIMEKAGSMTSGKIDTPIFIGGHPMAGTQHAGFAASLPHLFENAYYILTPLDSTPSRAVEALSGFLTSIGALPLVMDSKSHDSIVAAVSHLPHVVAAALVNTVGELDTSSHLYGKLAAGGFRDITRIASSNPDMWRCISLSNRKELIDLISSMGKQLDHFSEMLYSHDGENIENFFSSAKAYRDNLPARQALNLMSHYELYVDVEDRPGVIGEVATILGEANININNLRIIHSREGEPGSLVITLPDAKALENAKDVLTLKGYPCFVE